MALPQVRQRDLKSYCVVDTSTEKVYKSTYGPTGSHVFIKLLSLSGLNERTRHAIFNDVEYISKIKSERLMQMVGIYQTPNTMGIVTHWMPNGSLHSLIYQREIYPMLPLSLCIRILRDVAEGLNFLHNLYATTMHQHLKPSNILLDGQYHAKLSDFHLRELPKLAVSFDEDNNTQKVYLSPQRLQGHQPTTADDIYSLGIIMHETLSRKRPFQENNPLKWETEVLRGGRPQPSIDVILKASNVSHTRSADLSQFTNLCWHQNPNMRPTATECLSKLRNILQTFSSEEINRETDSFVNKKEMALQSSQSQALVVEFDIRYLDDCWLSSHRNRTQSAPVENTEAAPACLKPEKEKQRSATMPVQNSRNSSQIMKMGPLPKENKNKVGWTHGEKGDQCTCPSILWSKNCVDTLKRNREIILNRLTEGHLNQLTDIMMSRQIFLRDDFENIKAQQTPKDRVRKYLDTCYEKGEEASCMTLKNLLSQKIISWNQKHPV